MKAMIFAAGLGTRLQPLTNDIPKALVKIHNTTLLELVIKKLIRSGYNEIIINVHHHANQIVEFLDEKMNFGAFIQISDETDQLLDTGGGLKKASWFFDDNQPFLVYNVDVLSNIPLEILKVFHNRSGAMATLAVRKRKTSRYLLFDENIVLCGWENTKSGEQIITTEKNHYLPLAFSGIQIIDPSVFQLITDEGKFSIIDVYLKLAKDHKIVGFRHDDSYWLDLGQKGNIAEAQRIFNVWNS